jgi:hypothetical protein
MQLLPGTLLEDLRTQKMRLALTLFGIFWGTFAVVVLLSFGAGLERTANEEMGGGTGPVSLRNGYTTVSYRGLPKERPIRLRPADAQLLRREIPGIVLLSEVMSATRTLRAGEKSTQQSIYGVEPDYAPLQEIEIAAGGRFLNPRDIAERRHVAVLGNYVATELFGSVDPIGREFTMSGSVFKVVGVAYRHSASCTARARFRVLSTRRHLPRCAYRHSPMRSTCSVRAIAFIRPTSARSHSTTQPSSRRRSAPSCSRSRFSSRLLADSHSWSAGSASPTSCSWSCASGASRSA